ncbi:MAG: hypothetical protein R3B47_09165 [Bacteroidia bacterium]
MNQKSAGSLCKIMEMQEELQSKVLDGFDRCLNRLASAPEFGDYSAREQVLAFYFTWLEELKPLKPEILEADKKALPGFGPAWLKEVEAPFKAFVADMLAAASDSGEVAGRSLISERYKDIFWLQTRFLLYQWLRDDSQDEARTDALIEKTVHFCFDLLNPNLLDSGFDLLKFLIKPK